MKERYDEILSENALRFVQELHLKFNEERKQLLSARKQLQKKIDQGFLPGKNEDTASVRLDDWKVGPIPADLQDRRTEITGPVDRKMVINAMNSGAKVFMADFEDATSPTWDNCMQGQINLFDAIRRQIDFTAENGKSYALGEEIATLKVRPRGWHLEEKHLQINEENISASLFDFGLYFFHNAKYLLENGSGPYFYLPKLENHLEARLWNKVFIHAQELLDIPIGSIKVTVLIETILGALEMEEIIYELRDHLSGLNAGRWDYIFSVIKKFRNNRAFILPDRGLVGMNAPFMSSYAQLLVQICHKRGAHAIGGMSAFIPAKDEAINKMAFEKVAKDKQLEASIGYDGTWVAHPFLVPVAREEFDKYLTSKTHQKYVLRKDLKIETADLLDVYIPGGKITQEGVITNIEIGIRYIESWLRGIGAAALNNLMEDAATAEISRAQIWQWLHHEKVNLDNGQEFNLEYYQKTLDTIVAQLQKEGAEGNRFAEAIEIFNELVISDEFPEFLTLKAYDKLN